MTEEKDILDFFLNVDYEFENFGLKSQMCICRGSQTEAPSEPNRCELKGFKMKMHIAYCHFYAKKNPYIAKMATLRQKEKTSQPSVEANVLKKKIKQLYFDLFIMTF